MKQSQAPVAGGRLAQNKKQIEKIHGIIENEYTQFLSPGNNRLRLSRQPSGGGGSGLSGSKMAARWTSWAGPPGWAGTQVCTFTHFSVFAHLEKKPDLGLALCTLHGGPSPLERGLGLGLG